MKDVYEKLIVLKTCERAKVLAWLREISHYHFLKLNYQNYFNSILVDIKENNITEKKLFGYIFLFIVS